MLVCSLLFLIIHLIWRYPMENKQMKKNMGVLTAISVVVGCVIGAGVFFKPYAIYQATGGAPGMGMLSWIVGGIISILER